MGQATACSPSDRNPCPLAGGGPPVGRSSLAGSPAPGRPPRRWLHTLDVLARALWSSPEHGGPARPGGGQGSRAHHPRPLRLRGAGPLPGGGPGRGRRSPGEALRCPPAGGGTALCPLWHACRLRRHARSLRSRRRQASGPLPHLPCRGAMGASAPARWRGSPQAAGGGPLLRRRAAASRGRPLVPPARRGRWPDRRWPRSSPGGSRRPGAGPAPPTPLA